MPKGQVIGLFIAEKSKAPMQAMPQVTALAGAGIEGDRYCDQAGSFSKKNPYNRQVTLINSRFFKGSSYEYHESRRNIITKGVELMWLMDKRFQIGEVILEGWYYCDPCEIPTKLSGKEAQFKDEFEDCGGLVANVIEGGIITIGDEITPLGLKSQF